MKQLVCVVAATLLYWCAHRDGTPLSGLGLGHGSTFGDPTPLGSYFVTHGELQTNRADAVDLSPMHERSPEEGTLGVAAVAACWYTGVTMKVDRKTLQVEDMHADAEASDRTYWRARTPQERLRAVQIDRQVAYGRANTSRGLQRVLEIAERR